MIDSIDYEGLFKQLRSENEGLRLTILRLRNDPPSIVSKLSEWIQEFIEDAGNKQIVVTFAVVIFVSLIVPAIKTLCSITFRRFTHER